MAGLIGLFFVGVFWYASYLLTPMQKSGKPIVVDIPPGASAAEIGDILEKARLVRSSFAFGLTARILGESGEMKAGEYSIPPTLGVIEIISKLVAGDADAQWVVIPEGKTIHQIAAVLEDRRLARSSTFLTLAGRRPARFGVSIPSPRRSADGYLMPDSYKFPIRIGERAILTKMLENWEEKVYRPHRKLFDRSDLPVDKIVIMASLIEREARVAKDRPLISSVIRNRLRRGMRLEIDATVIYALGRHKSELALSDLKVESPYNTYRRHGLPPGPICNPGLASIQAALSPARSEYLYYVARPDGSHFFATSFQEHQANIARARELRAGAR